MMNILRWQKKGLKEKMEMIDTYIPLTDEEIKKDYEEIKKYHQQYLKPYDISLPAFKTNVAYQLIYLYHFQGKAVYKDVISAFVTEHNPKASGDQQVRHLGAQKGYCVFYNNDTYNGQTVKKKYYCLFTLEKPHPSWIAKQEARTIAVTTDDFTQLKENYNYRCATCGAEEGKIHPYTKQIVKLQKGHCDPNLPLKEGNIIPQCQYCNQNVYKDDFVFTLTGRPKCINNPSYILRSSESVQQKMYQILKAKYETI